MNTKRMAMVISLAAVLVLSPAAVAPAADKNWVGGTGSWFVPSNWSPAGVPTGTFGVDVQIRNGGTAQILTAGAAAGSVGVGNIDPSIGIQTASGTLDINGGGLSTAILAIGRTAAGTGTVLIRNGGTVVNSSIVVIDNGSATVDDGSWSGANFDIGGTGGFALLVIRNGGTVVSSSALSDRIGRFPSFGTTSTGGLAVDGVGSSWSSAGKLSVGESGIGLLAISDGGTVNSAEMVLGEFAGSEGSLLIGPILGTGLPGTIATPAITGGLGDASVYFNHTAEAYGFAPILQGNLQVQHIGPGTTVLSGVHTYSGDTNIERGWLRINGGSISSPTATVRVGTRANFAGQLTINGAAISSVAGFIGETLGANGTAIVSGVGSTWTVSESISVGGAGVGILGVLDDGAVSAAGGVNVTDNGTLYGDGTILAHVINSGTVMPGISSDLPGTLHVEGNYTQDATGILEMSLVSPADFSKLDLTGNLSLNGALSVAAIGFDPLVGQSFDLLDWGGVLSGTFSSIELPPLTGSLTWNTSQLYTSGVISVVPEPSSLALLALAVPLVACRLRSPRRAQPAS